MTALWLILPLLAPPAGATWVAEPVALGEGVGPAELDAVGRALCQALSESKECLCGTAPLLERGTPAADPGSGLQAARSLLAEGEELYMAFKFEEAAGMLSRAADLFGDSLAHLGPDDREMLYRARLLAGLSWFEAGKTGVAKDSFVRLIVIRPEFEPDPTLVSPKAREVYRQALSEVRAAGIGSLEIRTRPEGAQVVLDGLPRGKTPLTISPLAGGRHALKLSLPGYRTHLEEIDSPPGRLARSIELEPTLTLTAFQRLRQAARQGQAPEVAAADLDLIARTARLFAIVLAGVTRLENGDLLLGARRWTPAGSTTAAVRTRGENLHKASRELADLLVSGGWTEDRLSSEAPGLRLDFSKILLGVDPLVLPREAGPDDDGLLGKWWFWTGLAVVAGGLTAGIVVLASPGSPPPDHARFVLDF